MGGIVPQGLTILPYACMLELMKSITPADAKVSVQLRLPLPLRNRLVTRATQRDISLNQLCLELLELGVKG